MNIKECYDLLEVSPNISDDDLKKKYKELAKTYHPDIYKENPDKFKEINAAYQAVEEHRKNPFQRANISDETDFPFEFNINDVFSNFHGFSGHKGQQQNPARKVNDISTNIEITFEESVLGVEKEIEVDREVKCDICSGKGIIITKNNCNHCDGFGHSTSKQGHMTFSTICGYCRGQNTGKEDCKNCNKKTFIPTKTTMKVKIPAGVQDTNIIQLRGAGHFAQSSMFGDAYSNIMINVGVKNETPLYLNGNDVMYNLNISLLEALEGCSKTVPSIKGDETIEISSGSKNKDEIILPNLGVKLLGNEVVILNISYPENKEKLIGFLKEGQ